MNKPPHKHAEIIKAWADGVEIEFYDTDQHKWSAAPNTPNWTGEQYRVKPQLPTLAQIAVKAYHEYADKKAYYVDELMLEHVIEAVLGAYKCRQFSGNHSGDW